MADRLARPQLSYRQRMLAASITLVGVLALVLVPAHTPPARAVDEPVPEVPGQPAYVISDGAWTQYTAPTVLSTKTATYISSVTSLGAVQVTRIGHTYGNIASTVLQTKVEADDHAAPSLVQLSNGRIAAFYSGHGTTPVYYRVSNSPDSISSFGPRKTLAGSGMESMRTTYTHVLYLPGEPTYKYWLLTRGRDYTYWLTTSADLVRWTKGYQVMGNSFPNTDNHPYARFVSNGSDTIHFAMDEGHVGLTPDNSLYHMYYRKGSFYRTGGALIRTVSQVRGSTTAAPRPIQVQQGTLVHDGTGPKGKSRVFDLAMSETGPVIANYSETASKVRFVNWMSVRSGRWVSSSLVTTTDWVTGVALSHSDPALVFVTAGSTLFRYVTSDLGATWSSATLAENASAEEHQRVVTTPWGRSTAVDAVWMRGRYTGWNHGRFHTALIAWTRGLKPRTITTWYAPDWRVGGHIVGRIREGLDGPLLIGAPVSIQYRVDGDWVTGETRPTSASGTAVFDVAPPAGASDVRLYTPRADGWGLATTSPVSLD